MTMHSVRFAFASAAAILFVLCGAPVAAQTGGGQPQPMPPMPKPGPEHEVFKMDEGTWDAVVEMTHAPGMPPQMSKGVEVSTIGCGGLCLISDFKADMGGMPFHGHGTTTWDAAKKMYVGSWADSMSSGLSISEGTYDPATKKWTGTMQGPDMSGKTIQARFEGEWKDATTRVFTMFAPGPDGKEMQMLRITYTRRD